MGKDRRHTLIYLSGDNSREISISRFGLIFTFVLAGLLLVSIIAGSSYIGYRFLAHNNASGKIRSKSLIKTVESLQKELASAEAYLDSMVDLNNNIRLYADMPQHDLSIEHLGVGGRVQMANPGNSGNIVDDLNSDIEFLSTKVSVELENYKSLYADIQKHKERLAYIPAITPLDAKSYYISSNYGYRTDPMTQKRKFHAGIDLAANRGTPVHASGKGKVVFAAYSYGGYGNVVKVDHGDGYVSIYAHLNKIKVKKGQEIVRGDLVGEVGSTGRSTGPHLHYEIKKDGKPINPVKYMWDDKPL
jgi:murein DD-endopeptidase MepM/ murein hydrolase activator NlpD